MLQFFLLLESFLLCCVTVATAANAPASVQRRRQQQETCDASSNNQCQESSSSSSATTTTREKSSSCKFYLAESKVYRGESGLFATQTYNTGDTVNADFWLPIQNFNDNEYSQLWNDIALRRDDINERLRLETHYNVASFVAGIGSTSKCHDHFANIHPIVRHHDGDNNVTNTLAYIATSPIQVGQELLTTCSNDLVPQQGQQLVRQFIRPISNLESSGICIDRLVVKRHHADDSQLRTTVHSKRYVPIGQVVVSSPVVLIDKSQLEIVQQSYDLNEQKTVYTEHVVAYQELLNYCYGHVNSSLLFLPYGPEVHAISHSDGSNNTKTPNVKLTWNNNSMYSSSISLLSMEALEAMDVDDGSRLILDYTAIRDIQPGDEIVLESGEKWQKALSEYADSRTIEKKVTMPLLSSETEARLQQHHQQSNNNNEEPIRTVLEQSKSPYPKTIQTACWYRQVKDQGQQDTTSAENKLVWNDKINNDCLRPCHIVERREQQNAYTVRITDIPNPFTPLKCKLSNTTKGRFVHDVPRTAITFVNKPKPLDQATNNFRHELQVPDNGFYPETWYTHGTEATPMGDFLLPNLEEGQIEHIRFADTLEQVSDHAYVIGIPSSVRKGLLEFCSRMGITERFRELTYRGNGLKPGQQKEIELTERKSQWLIQRPVWKSNLHWISPLNQESHREFLQALSVGGYDRVLNAVGHHFGFDGLACYHIAFISVSHSSGGLMHYDVIETGGKSFAMIIPLMLVNGTHPELALQSSVEYDEETDIAGAEQENNEYEGRRPPREGGLKYRYEVAAMMGDGAHHSTSSVDYRVSKQMRMAATIYIADINKDNLDAILAETQNYPPRDNPGLLWSMAGRDWKRDDPTVKLPKPSTPAPWATEKL